MPLENYVAETVSSLMIIAAMANLARAPIFSLLCRERAYVNAKV